MTRHDEMTWTLALDRKEGRHCNGDPLWSWDCILQWTHRGKDFRHGQKRRFEVAGLAWLQQCNRRATVAFHCRTGAGWVQSLPGFGRRNADREADPGGSLHQQASRVQTSHDGGVGEAQQGVQSWKLGCWSRERCTTRRWRCIHCSQLRCQGGRRQACQQGGCVSCLHISMAANMANMSWHDMTWHDMTWHDMTWRDVTWHDMTWHDMTWHDVTLLEWSGHDITFRTRTDMNWKWWPWHKSCVRFMVWS